MEKAIKTNVKNANVFFNGHPLKKDIYIEDGEIKMLRDDVRLGVFSGVYELDAKGLYAVPAFTDCGCFALGFQHDGKELPKLSERDYKRYGFFSFVTSLNIIDKKERLIDQKKAIKGYLKKDMTVRFLTGGLKNKAYHTSENIYQDIASQETCVGASVIFQDTYGSIDKNRLKKLCMQVEAAAFDQQAAGMVLLYLGDMTLNLDFLFDIISEKPGREKTIMPWFINRGQAILEAGIDYLDLGGWVNLLAGTSKEKMSPDFVPLSDALLMIYKKRGTLEGVVTSSFSGGYLPKFDNNTMDQRGDIVNLYTEVKKAIGEGLPFSEALSVLSFNPIDAFDLNELMINTDMFASFLLVDKGLNIHYIIEGKKVLNPESFKNPVLFL